LKINLIYLFLILFYIILMIAHFITISNILKYISIQINERIYKYHINKKRLKRILLFNDDDNNNESKITFDKKQEKNFLLFIKGQEYFITY